MVSVCKVFASAQKGMQSGHGPSESFHMCILITGGPGKGQFFCPPADHGKGFKWQRGVAARLDKKLFSTY